MNMSPRLLDDSIWAANDACTLPTTEQPLRLAEFDGLFASALVAVERVSPQQVRLRLTGAGALLARVQDLVDRETACCSFFTFTLDTAADPGSHEVGLVLDVEVPPNRAEVIAGLTARACSHLAGAQS